MVAYLRMNKAVTSRRAGGYVMDCWYHLRKYTAKRRRSCNTDVHADAVLHPMSRRGNYMPRRYTSCDNPPVMRAKRGMSWTRRYLRKFAACVFQAGRSDCKRGCLDTPALPGGIRYAEEVHLYLCVQHLPDRR